MPSNLKVCTVDDANCAVFGMPRAAIERGVATKILLLEHITEVVCDLFAR